MEIRRSYDRLISTMGFPILVRRHLYIESGPWSLSSIRKDLNYLCHLSMRNNRKCKYVFIFLKNSSASKWDVFIWKKKLLKLASAMWWPSSCEEDPCVYHPGGIWQELWMLWSQRDGRLLAASMTSLDPINNSIPPTHISCITTWWCNPMTGVVDALEPEGWQVISCIND